MTAVSVKRSIMASEASSKQRAYSQATYESIFSTATTSNLQRRVNLTSTQFCLQSHLSQSSEGRIESFGKMPVHDGCKNLGHGVVIKRVN